MDRVVGSYNAFAGRVARRSISTVSEGRIRGESPSPAMPMWTGLFLTWEDKYLLG